MNRTVSDSALDTKLILGRYALLRLLSRGGMGSVYLARVDGAAGFRKPVAIKLIHQHLMDDAKAVNSFVLEAKLAVRLHHPNIVQVLDFGEHNGQYVMVLQYIHGYDLGVLVEYLRETGRFLSVEHSALTAYRILRGLEYAHELRDDHGEHLGLIHRDISPHNILISTEGQIFLTDFGIARIRNAATMGSQTELKGKLAYLSPEQVLGNPFDHRSDLFSLGIVLFEVLSGVRLFYSENEANTIMRISQAEVPDILALRPQLPAAVNNVLRRALARYPEDRYQSAGEFAKDLQKFLLGDSPDDMEPSFREMVRLTVSESSFLQTTGGVPDLDKELSGDPLFLPSLLLSQSTEQLAEPTTPDRRAQFKPFAIQPQHFIMVTASVMLIAAVISGTIFFGMSPSRQVAEGNQNPVKVIVEQRNGVTKNVDASSVEASTLQADAPVSTDADPPSLEKTPPNNGVKTPVKTVKRAAGPLDGRRVTRTLMGRRRAFLQCFKQGGDAATSNIKNVVMRFEVGRNGDVRWAKVEPSSVQNTPVGRCLASVTSNTSFPAHSSEALIFRVPLAVSSH